MLPMRQFVWFLCYFSLVLHLCGAVKRAKWKKFKPLKKAKSGDVEHGKMGMSSIEFQNCWADTKMIVATDLNYFSLTSEHIDEPPYRVLGVTPHCFVYYGWLHELVKKQPTSKKIFQTRFRDACKDFKPFLIRTEGLRYLLFVVAKRHGRKILIQSVAKRKHLTFSNETSVIWMKFNPFLRHMQFVSNQFPVGFVFQMLQNLDYRIYILGYSQSNSVILELKIFVDANHNLVPFITRKVLSVDPVIHPPIYGSWIIPEYNLGRKSSEHGFIFVRQIYENGKPKEGSYIANGIPMSSLVLNSQDGITPITTYDGYLYKSPYFKTYMNRNCPINIGNYSIYAELSYRRWSADTLPTAEFSLAKISARLWLNNLRYHRRMSYPHAYHEVDRRHIFRSWVKALPAILGLLQSLFKKNPI